jgi:ribonucleoside-diphosphate reductase alpha chain
LKALTSEDFMPFIDTMSKGLKLDELDLISYKSKIEMYVNQRAPRGLTWRQAFDNAAKRALDNLDKEQPDWQFLAGRLLLQQIYIEAGESRNHDKIGYGPFHTLLKILDEKGIYDEALLEKYSEEEINELSAIINPRMDEQYSYLSLSLFADRYLATDHDGVLFELPQERNLIIAMALMIDEKVNRLDHVKAMYWNLSNRYQTVATPTMKNAGMSFGQYSSCFIDTVNDSLDSIYLDNFDVARLSKDGGGIGVYIGKVRARGSDIKKFKGKSSGLLPWMKQLNNTAVSVDQLGQRKGAIAVYTDIWHKDAPMFIDARLNNGDERYRTHDLSLGLAIPDLFMEKVEAREMWYLFDPHEVRTKMGWSIEDYYDEQDGDGTFRKKYQELVDNEDISRKEVPALELMIQILRAQKETGYTYMFYRDEVNRMNPMKQYHEDGTAKTTIYCSNLCTEITQNMSPTDIVEEYVVEENGDNYTIQKRKHGDFVVCNLASINVALAERDGVLEKIIPTIVRGLDNVIDLNDLAVPQAKTTNRRYRAIGLGTFGWHHHLAIKGIKWESDAAVEESDRLYEKIAYLTIKASHELALEKGAFPLFEGSEWNTGEYFVRRGYVERNEFGIIIPIPGKEKWFDLCIRVMEKGIRNAYLMAVAPNMSTAKIGGSTDGIDPVFSRIYAEEKQDYKIPTTVPDLGPSTFFFYKNGFTIDQLWSIKQNAARQKHIDQAISFNLYFPEDVTASQILDCHMAAWKSKIKTTYYVRSQSKKKDDQENYDGDENQPSFDDACDACQ